MAGLGRIYSTMINIILRAAEFLGPEKTPAAVA